MLSVLPAFLLGALGVVVRSDLRFDALGLGLAVAAFYLTASTVALVTGRYALVERIGVRRTLLAGVAINALSMAWMAWVADSLLAVAGSMALAGIVNGITQPAASLAMARHVPTTRLGLALGIKQAALPAATLLAGLAVGAIAVVGDWHLAFAAGAALSSAFVVLALLFSRGPGAMHAASDTPRAAATPDARQPVGAPAVSRAPRARMTPVLVQATIASFLASVAANGLRVFYVESAVESGETLAVAGLLLSVASVAGIAARFVGGWRSDHSTRNPMITAGLLMLAGGVGYAMLAVVEGTLLLAIAGILGVAAGWGWSGLVNLAVVREQPEQAGAVTAYIHFSTLSGSLLGPVLFGLALTVGDYGLAWIATSIVGFAAAIVQLIPLRAR